MFNDIRNYLQCFRDPKYIISRYARFKNKHTLAPKSTREILTLYSSIGVVSSKEYRDFQPSTESLVEHEPCLKR